MCDMYQMIEIGREVGSACKFPGSGGAIVGMCEEEVMDKLRQKFEANGFVFVRLNPFAPTTVRCSVQQTNLLQVKFSRSFCMIDVCHGTCVATVNIQAR